MPVASLAASHYLHSVIQNQRKYSIFQGNEAGNPQKSAIGA
jgi:hypothetical protein